VTGSPSDDPPDLAAHLMMNLIVFTAGHATMISCLSLFNE
jgi:hypothetical protein